jgi:ribosomal subunit interface protein
MPFRVSGKNLEVGEALRERISGRVLEALEKFFDGGFSGHVTVGKEAYGFHTECVVHLDSGIVLRADSMAADPYLSADQAAEHLERRLRAAPLSPAAQGASRPAAQWPCSRARAGG